MAKHSQLFILIAVGLMNQATMNKLMQFACTRGCTGVGGYKGVGARAWV